LLIGPGDRDAGGKADFELLPIRSEDPDFLDRLVAGNPAFRRPLEERRREADDGRVSSLEEVRQRGDGPGR
jgi:hypothetical protein